MPKKGDGKCVHEAGPWPFITQRIYQTEEGENHVWSSRHHRKDLSRSNGLALPWLWMPHKLNWWIGLIFAIGASLFAFASILSLAPEMAQSLSLASAAGGIFFAGSIPFSIAAYLQLFQAANAGTKSRHLIGWQPREVGWLSCALQFVGTLLFNVNTWNGWMNPSGWIFQEVVIWGPNVLGSILFLASGYLAFIEAGHAHFPFRPRELSWWVVFINLLGCVSFMLSALFGVILPQPNPDWENTSLALTLTGALCFFFGSLLMWPEAAD